MLKYPNIKEQERKTMATPSFFDYAMADQGRKKTRAFLEEMKAYIPYERLETLLIEEGCIAQKEKVGEVALPIQVPYCLAHSFCKRGTG